jgi:hypothetical protein
MLNRPGRPFLFKRWGDIIWKRPWPKAIQHRFLQAGTTLTKLLVTVQGVYTPKSKYNLSFFKHYSHKSVLR